MNDYTTVFEIDEEVVATAKMIQVTLVNIQR